MGDFVTYWIDHQRRFMGSLGEHMVIVFTVLAWSLVVAALITLAIRRSRRVENVALQILGAVYSIPSLALFSLLIPFTGLGLTSATIVMVAYNQFLLVRNIVEGLNGVDASVVEAATGMGMSPLQVLTRVELPLAFPMIMAGIRLATISTIGIATIAATINAGGLGTILFSGLRTMNVYKIVDGTILCTAVALLANVLLKGVEILFNKRMAR